MQNTILIHAPVRRQGRGALVLAYTALFALLMGIWAAIFALNGQSFIQYGDTLKQHYPFLVYYGRWLRQAARCVLTGAAVPTWDFSIGYGADIITTLSYYGLGDPLDLLAAFVPGRWTEQLLEGLIVLRLYLAGLAFMAFSRRHGNSRFGTLLGALAYVFSAWPIQAGLIEPVFLVPMYCFPLMLLGADDLFEGRSPVLYIAAIALTVLSNFLFFYMAAVLLVLYAIAVYSKRYGAKNLRTLPPLLAKFIGFALVGIAISAVTLLPTAQELFGSARFGLTRETAPYPFYRFFELLANMTTGMGYDAYSTYAGVTSAAFLGVLVLFAKPRQNTVLKCAWLGLLALLLVPQAGSVLNGISYVSNRWVWAFTMLEAFILARVCPGITAFEPKEKRNLFALLAVYCVVAFCVKQGRTETALLGALLLAVMVTIAFVNVVVRYCTPFSFAWTEELTINFFVWIVLLGSARSFRDGSHLGMSILYDALPKSLRFCCYLLSMALCLGFFGALAWTGWLEVRDEYELEVISEALAVPVWWYTIATPLFSVLTIFRMLQRACADLRSGSY